MKGFDSDKGQPATGTGRRSANPTQVGGLDISPTDDGCIISLSGQERIHFLNPTAVLILELCNGENSPEKIVELVKEAYGLAEAPIGDVRDVLKQLKAEGLLQ